MLKRTFDIICSGCVLILLAPVFLLLYIIIRKNLGSPVIFRQVRPGLFGKNFEMVKFRTMTSEVDMNGDLLPDSARLTNLGRFLRKTSLDELPEMWNILKGDMSFIGPRPLLVRYMPYYTDEEHTRHNVRPGLTGLAQVAGRNLLTWEEKLALDVHYVKHQSIFMDLKILFRTFGVVMSRKGVLEGATQGPLDRYREKIKGGISGL